MVNNKYCVIKFEDAQSSLTPEELNYLDALTRKIRAYRHEKIKKRSPDNSYIVLNTTDPHTIASLDAYIESAEYWLDNPPDVTGGEKKYTQGIVDIFRTIRYNALLSSKTRNPD